MNDKNLTINITSGTVIKIIAILLIGVFLYLIRDIMVAVLFSVVIASGVEPAAVWFKKRRERFKSLHDGRNSKQRDLA